MRGGGGREIGVGPRAEVRRNRRRSENLKAKGGRADSDARAGTSATREIETGVGAREEEKRVRDEKGSLGLGKGQRKNETGQRTERPRGFGVRTTTR